MVKNNKNILIVSFSILIIIICFVYFLSYRQTTKKEFQPTQVTQTLPVIISPKIEGKPLSGASASLNTEVEKTEEKVILIVFEKKYEVAIKENDSVYKAMENLQKNKENNFTFSYKEYPSLGIFINKINNMEGGRGKYWLYYVNGEESTIGVSEYILKGGDIIKWELK